MKLEALQSLSVAVMIAGLFLSALGGFGAYFFSGGSERPGSAPLSAQVESAEPELPLRDASEESNSKFAALVEPVPEVTAKQISLLPEPGLPPVAEKLPTPAPAPATPPAPVIAATPAPKPAPPKPDFTPVVAKTEKSESKPVPAPPTVAEKLPTPAPVAPPKPAPTENTLLVAKAAVPESKAPAPTLGIEPWQKEKLLQRLRAFQNGTIAIQVPQGNGDALSFATALKEAFVTAGWQVASLTEVKTDREQTGLTLSSGTFPPPTEVTTVFSALVSAGMKLSTDLDPSQGKKHAILFVGSRP